MVVSTYSVPIHIFTSRPRSSFSQRLCCAAGSVHACYTAAYASQTCVHRHVAPACKRDAPSTLAGKSIQLTDKCGWKGSVMSVIYRFASGWLTRVHSLGLSTTPHLNVKRRHVYAARLFGHFCTGLDVAGWRMHILMPDAGANALLLLAAAGAV